MQSAQDNSNWPPIETVAKLCYAKFKLLPKTGKPTPKEWTVLAGVVLHDSAKGTNEVVALGAGTKCLGQSKLTEDGWTLHDSHAEVLARRGFMRYLYRELRKAAEATSENEILSWDPTDLNFHLKPGISFHFLSTQTPCGDACIAANTDEPEGVPAKKKKTASTEEEDNDCIGEVLPTDGIFTGAKLIGTEHQDAMLQTLGAVRTKPGRGDRTLSVSCSDKLSKWNLLGVQGALLDELLAQPIYFKTLNFCCAANKNDLERAIYGRWLGRSFASPRYNALRPEIRIYEETPFQFTQHTEKSPAPNGLVWCNIAPSLKPYEISVNGKRQGITSKQLNTPQSALQISRYYLLREFIAVLNLKTELLEKFNTQTETLLQMQYQDCKQLANTYQMAWSEVKETYFQQWTQKPDKLKEFVIVKLK